METGRPQQSAARRAGTAPHAPRRTEHRRRVRRLQASHSYGLVLYFVIGLFVYLALAPDGTWSTSLLVVLECVTLVCALWTSGVAQVGSLKIIALLVIALLTAFINVLPGGHVTTVALAVYSALLAIAIVVVIGRGVLDQGQVNKNSVRGAIAAYLLLGMIFSFLYGAVAVIGHGAFFTSGTDGTRALRTYFSFITLATVGYGDYTPAGTVGHTLAMLEALVGQLYLVTVVAVLVSRLGQDMPPIEQDDPPSVIPGG
jgi:hypothetical protein